MDFRQQELPESAKAYLLSLFRRLLTPSVCWSYIFSSSSLHLSQEAFRVARDSPWYHTVLELPLPWTLPQTFISWEDAICQQQQ